MIDFFAAGKVRSFVRNKFVRYYYRHVPLHATIEIDTLHVYKTDAT